MIKSNTRGREKAGFKRDAISLQKRQHNAIEWIALHFPEHALIQQVTPEQNQQVQKHKKKKQQPQILPFYTTISLINTFVKIEKEEPLIKISKMYNKNHLTEEVTTIKSPNKLKNKAQPKQEFFYMTSTKFLCFST